MIVKLLMFFIIFSIEILLIGTLCATVIKSEKSLSSISCLGFISILSVFFILATLFRVFNLSLSSLSYTFAILLLVADMLSIFLVLRYGILEEYCSQAKNVMRLVNENKVIFSLIAVTFIINIFLACCCYWATSDDSFYLPKAMEMLSKNVVSVTESVAWLGYDAEGWSNQINLSTMEAFRAAMSYLSGIPVTVLSRNAFCVILIIISYFSVWQLTGSAVRENDKSELIKILTLLFYNILLLLFGGFMNREMYSLPFWQIRYIWQGKSIMISIIFPLIMKECIDIYNSNGDSREMWRSCLLLAWTLIAAASTTRVAVIFSPILCFILAVPYLIYKIAKKDIQWKVFAQIFVAILPIAVVAGVSMLSVSNAVGNDLFTPAERLDIHFWNEMLGEMFGVGHWIFWALYAIGLIFFLFKGNWVQRAVFIATPVVLFLTFLNPLLINFVVKYVSKGVYWRLYWLLPMWYVFPLALSIFITDGRLSLREIDILAIGISASLMLCGYLKVWNTVEIRGSLYSLDRRTEAVAEYILNDCPGNKKPIVLDMAKEYMGVVEIRQYSSDIILYAGHRNNQRRKNPDQNLQSLYEDLKKREAFSNDDMKAVIDSGHIDYVTGKTDDEPLFENIDCLEKVFTIDDFIVWGVR